MMTKSKNEEIIGEGKAGLALRLSEPTRFSNDQYIVLATAVSKKRFYEMLVDEDIIDDEEDFKYEDFLKVVGTDYISYREEEDDCEFEDGKAWRLGAKPKSKGSHKVWVRL